MLIISIVVFWIYRKRRERRTCETIFDESTVPMTEQLNGIQPPPLYSDTSRKHEDETFDAIDLTCDHSG